MIAAPPGPASVLLFVSGLLLGSGNDGALRVFDPGSGALVAEGPPGTGITRLAAAPGGHLVASAHNDGSVRVSALPRATVVATLAWHTRQVLGLAWGISSRSARRLSETPSLPARRRAGSGSAP